MNKNKILLFSYDKNEIHQSEIEQIAKMIEPRFKAAFPDTVVLFLPNGIDILSVTHLDKEE